jgi:hypothetical protein
MAQFARPTADDATGGWGTAPLFSKLQTYPWSQIQASTLFIESANAATGTDGQCVKFSLNSVTDPGTNEGHKLRVCWYRNGAGPISGAVELYQGASTLIATLTNAALDATHPEARIDEHLLSTTEAGNITDYSDLNIWIRPTGSTDLRVRGVELELPSAPLRALPAGVPTDVYASYDASTFDLADAAAIDAWQDESGNGHSLVSRATGKPSYKASAAEVGDGLPVVRFDGVDDRLAVAWGETIAEPFTWVFSLVVRSFTSGSATQTAVIAAGDQDLWTMLGTGSTTIQKFATINESITTTPDTTLNIPDWMMTQAGAQHAVGGTPVIDQHHVLVLRWIAGEDEMWQDGVRIIQSDAGDDAMVGIQIGCREPPDRWAQVDIRRLLIFDRAVTDEEVTDISTALAAEESAVTVTGAGAFAASAASFAGTGAETVTGAGAFSGTAAGLLGIGPGSITGSGGFLAVSASLAGTDVVPVAIADEWLGAGPFAKWGTVGPVVLTLPPRRQ